ncbi:hypothetical protein BJ742DRAFT_899486 [Cladochytrium replicatum]|nr:hypothetical protein BJ742DRAFT_899486 [Cladochytrium replicatum]
MPLSSPRHGSLLLSRLRVGLLEVINKVMPHLVFLSSHLLSYTTVYQTALTTPDSAFCSVHRCPTKHRWIAPAPRSPFPGDPRIPIYHSIPHVGKSSAKLGGVHREETPAETLEEEDVSVEDREFTRVSKYDDKESTGVSNNEAKGSLEGVFVDSRPTVTLLLKLHSLSRTSVKNQWALFRPGQCLDERDLNAAAYIEDDEMINQLVLLITMMATPAAEQPVQYEQNSETSIMDTSSDRASPLEAECEGCPEKKNLNASNATGPAASNDDIAQAELPFKTMQRSEELPESAKTSALDSPDEEAISVADDCVTVESEGCDSSEVLVSSEQPMIVHSCDHLIETAIADVYETLDCGNTSKEETRIVSLNNTVEAMASAEETSINRFKKESKVTYRGASTEKRVIEILDLPTGKEKVDILFLVSPTEAARVALTTLRSGPISAARLSTVSPFRGIPYNFRMSPSPLFRHQENSSTEAMHKVA